ncbi:VOC family protein [Rhizobium sp. L1K21]|uniref:VOC family protein n=1 Tax=Rhizobium sp. L1K21 TaxID=2954933 RepID=UPI0020936001|nr:VOC family protein [Rhizobium sp. L1K21]MCO6187396.1 VOC family protein [Rhizobium sp. L1K21]
MPLPIEGILETALYVHDLEAAEAFYGGLLGLEVVTKAEGRHVFFRCGPGILLVFNADATRSESVKTNFPVPAHGTTGQGHACFRVARENIEAIRAKLVAADVEIEADFCWPNGARSIYFRDPAGNSLECAEPALWGIDDTQA